jgi:predicted Zn-dependent protease
MTAVMMLLNSGMCFCSEVDQGSPALAPAHEKTADSVPPQETEMIIGAMKAEMERSMEKLSLKGYENPYYISYVIKETRDIEATAKCGAIFSFSDGTDRPGYVEVRVGSPEIDNSKGLEFDYDRDRPQSARLLDFDFPLENDAAAIRNRLWLLTDLLYKKAVADYMKKRGMLVFRAVREERANDFSVEEKRTFVGPASELVFDKASWLGFLKRSSEVFLNYPELVDSAVEFSATHEKRYLVNSEGSSIVEDYTAYWLDAWAMAWSDDGMLLTHSIDYACRDHEELPGETEMAAAIEKMISELKSMQKAEEIKPCTVPAIFDPEMSSAFIHEAIGHRLEGSRLEEEEEGHTFKDKVGQKVLPEFLTLLDNPELREFNGKSLYGHYHFDEEGVPGQKIVLVENGILKNYLMSRRTAKGFPKSNGHGRLSIDSFGYYHWYGISPMSRMANLIVRSSNELSSEELEKGLIEECKKRGVEFGLIFEGTLGGHTSTAKYDYQAFTASPRLVYRLDAKTGARTLVRGVSLVGTPLNALDKIVATGDDYGVFNAYCGAESGVIPNTGIAPSILLSEIEVQKIAEEKERHPILPPPAFDE